MANTAQVSVDGVDYTITSDGNFLPAFVHYYTRFLAEDGTVDTEYTVWGLIVYSGGGAPIVFKCEDREGNWTEGSTIVMIGEELADPPRAAAPHALTGKVGQHEPIAISGFREDTVFLRATYDILYDEWADATTGQFLTRGADDAVARMPKVCNAQCPILGELPAGYTCTQGTVPEPLVCTATVTYGGTLAGVMSYAWYEGDTLVSESQAFTPPTDQLGERTYYCVVTNTLDDPDYGTDAVTAVSGTVTVKVVPAAAPGALNRLSMTLGWLMGRKIAERVRGQKAPVAYLYNGVRLPPLPEWDKETYPYAFVYILPGLGTVDFLKLICFRVEHHCVLYLSGSDSYAIGFSGDGEEYLDSTISYPKEADVATFEFPVVSVKTGIAGRAFTGNVTWSNYDILDVSGNVVCAASEPVPVYE